MIHILKRFFQSINKIFWFRFVSPERYARHIGVKIGKNCLIGTRNWSTEPYLVTIGDNVQLAHGVSIHTHGGGQPVRQYHPGFDIFGKVQIMDWAYIGAFSQIMPGVTIGEGAIVAAGSIVTRSVPPHTVVGGNPARYICTLEEYYERNKAYDLGTKNVQCGKKKEILLSMPEDMFVTKPFISVPEA